MRAEEETVRRYRLEIWRLRWFYSTSSNLAMLLPFVSIEHFHFYWTGAIDLLVKCVCDMHTTTHQHHYQYRKQAQLLNTYFLEECGRLCIH